MRKTSPLTYIIVLAVAACGICYILSQAALSDLRHGVTALKEELRVRAAENSAVRAAVYERTDTAEIERRAYEMGMTKPAEHQIIRVAASRSSYFNQIADGDAAPQPAGALESVIEGIRSGIAR
jgi:hypothetical protein